MNRRRHPSKIEALTGPILLEAVIWLEESVKIDMLGGENQRSARGTPPKLTFIPPNLPRPGRGGYTDKGLRLAGVARCRSRRQSRLMGTRSSQFKCEQWQWSREAQYLQGTSTAAVPAAIVTEEAAIAAEAAAGAATSAALAATAAAAAEPAAMPSSNQVAATAAAAVQAAVTAAPI